MAGRLFKINGAPAGAAGQLQYNGNGKLAADSSLSFDPTSKTLSISGVPRSTQVPFELSGDYGSIRLTMTDSDEVFGLELRAEVPPGGGYLNDVGIAAWRDGLNLFRIEGRDQTALNLTHYDVNRAPDQTFDAILDGATLSLSGYTSIGSPFVIAHSGGDLLAKTSGGLGLWSGNSIVEFGPPSAEVGPPAGQGNTQLLTFRAFDGSGLSIENCTIECRWMDTLASISRLRMSAGDGVLLNPGLLIESPGGVVYKLTVDDAGVLTTVEVPPYGGV